MSKSQKDELPNIKKDPKDQKILKLRSKLDSLKKV